MFKEANIASKFKPVKALVSISEDLGLENAVHIYATLGNEMIYFDNYQINDYHGVSLEQSVHYKNLKKSYLNGALQSQNSQIKVFGMKNTLIRIN